MQRRIIIKNLLATIALGSISSRLIADIKISESSKDSKFTDAAFVDYTARDYEIVDYKFYSLPGIPGLGFRGPRPQLESGQYFTCMGASQTLGVLVEKPFPALLSEKLGIANVNLGLGGARPGFFGHSQKLIGYANQGQFLILQVMSARGEPNSRFHPSNKIEHLFDTKHGDVVSTSIAWDRVLKEEPEKLPLYVAESRNSWVKGNLDILQKIKVPVILFWFSDKNINTPLNYSAENGVEFMGEFPQLVDECSLNSIRNLCAGFVSCTSGRNRGHEYISRFNGKAVEIDYNKFGVQGIDYKERYNHYYHTQEMNEDAVPGLLKEIQRLALGI